MKKNTLMENVVPAWYGNGKKCLLFKPLRSDSSVLQSEPKVNIAEA